MQISKISQLCHNKPVFMKIHKMTCNKNLISFLFQCDMVGFNSYLQVKVKCCHANLKSHSVNRLFNRV